MCQSDLIRMIFLDIWDIPYICSTKTPVWRSVQVVHAILREGGRPYPSRQAKLGDIFVGKEAVEFSSTLKMIPGTSWNLEPEDTWNFIQDILRCTFELAGIWWGMWSISCAPWDSMLTGWFNRGAGSRCLCFWVVGMKWTMENHHLQNARQIAVMQRQLDSVSILPVSFECLSQLAFEAVLSFLPLSEVGGDTSEWWWKQNSCLLC